MICTPKESGIEWIVLKKPTLKYFVVILEFSSISIIFVFSSPLCSLNFLRIKGMYTMEYKYRRKSKE